ncbi:MAG TPA: hypothetical protein VE954_11145 [Oligoflexus sp.]|uniref:hypothetical protein n=1 Tax=Oligoflexus sp. TaxID=1971216 RepID=UPI002D300C87|nr:hypothetical protein [Oligoflexus sp.]HYX33661.1 hypothetical protein [Oligoflexus sp.]
MTLQTIRKILFTMLALFAFEVYAEEQAVNTNCSGKQTAQLPLDRSGDLGKQASMSSAATGMSQVIFQNAGLNRIAGETNASCCKICRNSQACGDDCINWSKICHIGAGCACQQ